jgi:pyruvate dehydrogenase E1 component alpha subunit
MAEILGKETGYCRGRGGSMHVAAFDVGSLGAYPIVAQGVPVGVGAALSSLLLGRDHVVVSFFGDGALGQGTLHESLNLAAIWSLPVVFLCENNQFAVSSRVENTVALSDRTEWARAYGMDAQSVDGQDVQAVYMAAKEAVDRARAGDGPAFLECRTYRYEGHYFGEAQVYRTRAEVDEVRQSRDPITGLAATLMEQQGMTAEQLDSLKDEASAAIEAALRFAEESPEPPAEEYGEWVYA